MLYFFIFFPKYAGLCISSYIADDDDVDYVAAGQLDEIYQVCFLYSALCNEMFLFAAHN